MEKIVLVSVILGHNVDSMLKYTIDDDKMQILTRYSHYLTFLFKHLYDHSLTQVGLPIFEWEMLKLFIYRWVEK